MRNKAQFRVSDDPFRAARGEFDQMIAWLDGNDVPSTAADIERAIGQRGRNLLRKLMQARLDLLYLRECVKWEHCDVPAGVEVRARKRQLETELGRLRLWRHGVKRPNQVARFELDEQLNLPQQLYSHPLRQRVADEVRTGAWDQAVERIDRGTGGMFPSGKPSSKRLPLPKTLKRSMSNAACRPTTH